MNSIPQLYKSTLSIFLCAAAISCTPQKQQNDFTGTWMEVKKAGSSFQRIDCGYDGEIIRVTDDSVYHKGVMEDTDFKIDHTKQEADQVTFFPNQTGQSSYRFSWVNQQRGIVRLDISIDGAAYSKYLVNQLHSKNIKTVKGTAADCITAEGAEESSSKPVNSGLNELQNPKKLLDKDVYGIADILASTPVTKTNLPVYHQAARNLMHAGMYNEARIILLELVPISPANAALFLDLGDAQWGFNDQSGAKTTYQQYLELNKDSMAIPPRVSERLK